MSNGVNSAAGNYFSKDLRPDIVAGLTVAVVAIPQSMALALIAGIDPVYGLYTSIVACIIGSALGRSKHLVTGPTTAIALMVATTIAAYDGETDPVELVFLLTFMVGLIQLSFGLLRLGTLMNYISNSVIIGFTAGAGILIAGKQVANFFGLTMESTTGHSFLSSMTTTVRFINTTNPLALTIGVATIATIIIMQRVDRRIPGALVATIAAAAAVYFLGLSDKGVRTVGDISSIPRGLPPFRMVSFHFGTMRDLASGAIAIAIIGLMEAMSIAKSIASSSGQQLDANREFVAQGLANTVGSFFRNFASSGSFVRSAVNYRAGARTRMAGVFSGILVAAILLLLGPYAEYIPISALAGLLMLVAFQMVNWGRMRVAIQAGRESAIVLFVTMAATLIFHLDLAIYIGVGLALLSFVRRSSAMQITRLVPTHDGAFQESMVDQSKKDDVEGRTVILNVAGEMFFGAMDDLQAHLNRIIDLEPAAIVLRLKRAEHLRSTGLVALEKIAEHVREHDIPMIICGVDDELMSTLQTSGFLEWFGEDRVVPADESVLGSTRKALHMLETLVKSEGPIDYQI
jgi:SulP family sulfate permease